jgi:hypothetical protein
MFLARITGVIPKGMNLPAAPVETREFDNITAAKQWLLGEALTNLPTPVYTVQVFQDGQSVWQAYHTSHDALSSKNELWWDARDPERHEREKARVQRKRQVESGAIPYDQLSLKEQFDKANPAWSGPFFAWLPTSTVDAGTIWLKYKNKMWFPHD